MTICHYHTQTILHKLDVNDTKDINTASYQWSLNIKELTICHFIQKGGTKDTDNNTLQDIYEEES